MDGTTGNPNLEQFTALDGIRITPARDAHDLSAVFHLRSQGYHKYFSNDEETKDDIDGAEGSTLLLARCAWKGTPLGTLRVVSPPTTPELASHVDLEALLPAAARPVAEASRFVVLPGPHTQFVKLLLQKAFYQIALRSGAETMLIWARPGGCRLYSRLLFSDLGDAGSFSHPKLGGRRHRTLALSVSEAASLYAAAGHGLYSFFVEQQHPNLAL